MTSFPWWSLPTFVVVLVLALTAFRWWFGRAFRRGGLPPEYLAAFDQRQRVPTTGRVVVEAGRRYPFPMSIIVSREHVVLRPSKAASVLMGLPSFEIPLSDIRSASARPGLVTLELAAGIPSGEVLIRTSDPHVSDALVNAVAPGA